MLNVDDASHGTIIKFKSNIMRHTIPTLLLLGLIVLFTSFSV